MFAYLTVVDHANDDFDFLFENHRPKIAQRGLQRGLSDDKRQLAVQSYILKQIMKTTIESVNELILLLIM